ncbi:hypothetical protein [Celeribacter neptunius]|uniref:Uncharacterized protein n=1 Tax=Celeribacter neptunius TaxID=588602 RepID=A0A1I3KP28_9RHOB|nr:hypothetical protein [Celeribacter neptunius]SFI74197.1 hypothetical protein SAMN04487991_0753 [Celeribacter neptunius]
MPRKISNPYAAVKTTMIGLPKLEDSDLDLLADDPNAFFAEPGNRAKLFGMPADKLKLTLAEYGLRKGVDQAAMIKSVITEIDW